MTITEAGGHVFMVTSEEKFTPGPWKWWTSNSWRRLTAHKERGDVNGREGGVICPVICRDRHPDLIISEADMALIAAAPDMYAALEDARKAVQLLEDLTACRADDDYVAQLSATIEAALRKARGEP